MKAFTQLSAFLMCYALLLRLGIGTNAFVLLPQSGLTRMGTQTALFTTGSTKSQQQRIPDASPESDMLTENENGSADQMPLGRRNVLASLLAGGGVMLYDSDEALADDDDESFASIAARASKISQDVAATRPSTTANRMIQPTDKSCYDFSLPVRDETVAFAQLIRQEFSMVNSELKDENGQTTSYKDVAVKAIIVVNIKQDDPVARKDIPELISLASKYAGRETKGGVGSLAIVACPTDQGYYEPDTSQLLRLKLASEYGYGINPATILTDKVNILGTGAVPFWRWLEKTCRTPSGLGRVEGNFEKFLLDGRTGLPVRRYPRKYRPLDMKDDVEAIIAGKLLPPARANYFEEWRVAAAEAERDTYRFEKGLNVFDQ